MIDMGVYALECVDRRCADWVIGGGADARVWPCGWVVVFLVAFPKWAAISFGASSSWPAWWLVLG